jgi:hypothetical protein
MSEYALRINNPLHDVSLFVCVCVRALLYIYYLVKFKTVLYLGTDMESGKEGGTWFAVSDAGRIATLVNIAGQQDPSKRGRGKPYNPWSVNYV